jgi:PAS domain S-box-containing protein
MAVLDTLRRLDIPHGLERPIGIGLQGYWDGAGAAVPGLLGRASEMSERIAAMDWSRTSIGPIEGWSHSLRTMVSFMLANRFPLLLWWGPDYVSIYNDAYRPILGAKHPWALGRPVRECWSEIWDVLEPLIDTPFRGGPATWNDDLFLEVNRHGFTEETHFTVAYSPVPDESVPGGIGGVLATVHEITEKIVGERRIIALRDLGACSGEAKTAAEACSIAMKALRNHAKDVPFAALYLFDERQSLAHLAGAAGVQRGESAAPISIALGGRQADQPWPIAEVLRCERTVVVDDLAERLRAVPSGPWPDPPHTAVVVPIKSNAARRFAGFLVSGVSPRLRLDEQYRSFFELLASQIATAIATARAYEDERRRAEALAEIDHAKTLFFSNVSHEFRTPLTLMLGPLEDALADSDLPVADRERLDVVHRNSLRLLKLVNTLLDFSRIEAGRAQASYEAVDLVAVTVELASNFRSACERAGLDLVVDCASLPEPVYVDRDMWEKIVLNLLSNAFKFTFEGQIAVGLRAVNGSAELSVRDTGVGIAKQELPRLFERFHRIEGQKSRTYEGSGIGLALVQELVKFHRGSIRVESEPGRGTTFTVSIPLGTAHLPAERLGAEQNLASTSVRAEAYVQEAVRWLPDALPSEARHATDSSAICPLSASARVLVADDNADMRAYLCSLLGPHCEIVAVADGQAALEAARQRRPDLLITDAMMPRLDGFALARAIRNDPGLRELPIIMLSARAGEESRVAGLEAGADDYLVKPFSGRELVARASVNLKLAQVRRQGIEALRDSERRYRDLAEERRRVGMQFETLLKQAPLGVFLVDSAFRICEANPVARPVFGDIADLIGRDFDEVIQIQWPKPYADEMVQRFRHTLETGEPYEAPEWIHERLDRKVTEYYEWRIDRIQLAGGRFGVVCYFRDISAHVAARERLKLLIEELNHRVKNTLATVQSIAMQTLRDAPTSTEGRQALEARLLALASAHDVLTRRHWQGADICEVIQGSLAAYRTNGGESRLNTAGPNIRLLPRAALALSMALHELATNAAKYGALSNSSGRVEVEWKISTGAMPCFSFRWAESGGPPVSAPKKRGFGSRLIERGLAQDLDGDIRLEFAPGGVICTIAAPLSEIGGSHAKNDRYWLGV